LICSAINPSYPRPICGNRPRLAKPARYVALCALVRGLREDLLRLVVLDEHAVPTRLRALEREERGHVRDPGRLLHVMGDDHERVLVLQLVDQVLDLRGRDRIQRRSRLVEQDDVRLDSDRPRYAEALLLAAGEAEGALLEAVLDLVPEGRLRQCALYAAVEIILHPEYPQAPSDVVVDRLRERVRLLEDHPHSPSDLDWVDTVGVDVLVVVQNLPFDARARDEVVHPVQRPQEGALAAARRPDD